MGRRPRIPAALVELLGQEGPHAWSLEELHAGLLGHGVQADFSSVFRAAAKLEAEGVLRRVDLGDGRSRFEATGMPDGGHEARHHDHIRCDCCGLVTAVPCGLVHSAVRAIERSTGFAVSGHSLVLTGTCPSCAGQAGGQSGGQAGERSRQSERTHEGRQVGEDGGVLRVPSGRELDRASNRGRQR